MEVTIRCLGSRVAVRQLICTRCLHRRSKTAATEATGLGLPRVPQQQTRRRLHGTRIVAGKAASSQSPPLADFYADLLAMPIPRASEATTATTAATAATTSTTPPSPTPVTRSNSSLSSSSLSSSSSSSPASDLPTFVQSGDLTKEERARKLFGSIKGSGYERQVSDTPDETWQTVNGVLVPPRPQEPDNCCMSGCVNCVWDDYRIDVEHWANKLRQAKAKGSNSTATKTSAAAQKVEPSRSDVSAADASISMDDDGGGSEALWTSSGVDDEADAIFNEIPVGIREFMATEKKLKARKVKQNTAS